MDKLEGTAWDGGTVSVRTSVYTSVHAALASVCVCTGVPVCLPACLCVLRVCLFFWVVLFGCAACVCCSQSHALPCNAL